MLLIYFPPESSPWNPSSASTHLRRQMQLRNVWHPEDLDKEEEVEAGAEGDFVPLETQNGAARCKLRLVHSQAKLALRATESPEAATTAPVAE